MISKNILKDYGIENDDIYILLILFNILLQEIVYLNICRFTVSYKDTLGYTLMITGKKKKNECKVILYDGLSAPMWKISS